MLLLPMDGWYLWRKGVRAARDSDGRPICGGCRNQVEEEATVCENCGSELLSVRRAKLVGGLCLFVGGGGVSFGLVSFLLGVAILGDTLIGAFVLFLLTLPLAVVGMTFIYPAYRIAKDRPVRELQLGKRFPAPVSSVLDRITG